MHAAQIGGVGRSWWKELQKHQSVFTGSGARQHVRAKGATRALLLLLRLPTTLLLCLPLRLGLLTVCLTISRFFRLPLPSISARIFLAFRMRAFSMTDGGVGFGCGSARHRVVCDRHRKAERQRGFKKRTGQITHKIGIKKHTRKHTMEEERRMRIHTKLHQQQK